MECARMLKLGNLTEHLEELLHQAQEKQLTYPEFLLACLREEVRTRENRKYLCRLKAAGLPARHAYWPEGGKDCDRRRCFTRGLGRCKCTLNSFGCNSLYSCY